MPKVSVIIPAYNAEKYIAETLDSVLNQTYSDYEVIIVDDGSKDKTVSIIKQYQAKYPEKVGLIQKENGGPASARNMGIRTAIGEYIAFIDADDLWLPEKLEKQIKCFEAQPSEVGMVYTDAKKFDGDGIWTLPEKYRHNYIEGWIYKDLLKANFIPNQSVIVRKRCFEKTGLFDESIELISMEDYEMWLRIAKDWKISFFNETLSLYREQAQGISKKFESSLTAGIRLLEKHSKLVTGNSYLEETVKSTLAQRLYNFGYFYLREGCKAAARDMFSRSLEIRFKLKILFMKMATFVPFQALNMLNKLLKTFLKPPQIVKTRELKNKEDCEKRRSL